ncbi:MAG: formylmethanofuran dehydrogenase subunit B [Planctomycetaceae bacterium]|nr:formylmethanofuran dehydrogenase subunit B [Planctomycetaceae bacterium]
MFLQRTVLQRTVLLMPLNMSTTSNPSQSTCCQSNVVCPGCGCVCDDVAVEIIDGQLAGFSPSCPKGESWFRAQLQSVASENRVDGAAVDLDVAVDRAAEILEGSIYPLVYGLSRSATPGQRAAVALAEHLGGVVDTTASLCHGPSIMAIQDFGEVTCTLGEVRNRADLVVFWGCDPASSHPRHSDRYSVTARGRFVPEGRGDRIVVMIGDERWVHSWRLDDQGTLPDYVIPVSPGADFELLCQLRAMLKQDAGTANRSKSVGDFDPASNMLIPEARFAGKDTPTSSEQPAVLAPEQLLSLMTSCRYGAVFFGLGLADTSLWEHAMDTHAGHANVSTLLQLVAELNSRTRFIARRMRLQGDVSGADNVLCWQTGYPFGVDFSRGYPRYNPGEYTATELLERGDVDAMLIIGAETVSSFSSAAQRFMRSIPTILIDYPSAKIDFSPDVHITTAVYGVHAAGTAYRMDNVPLPLRALLPSRLPTDEQVLESIRNRIS